jgi:hypothetical protein
MRPVAPMMTAGAMNHIGIIVLSQKQLSESSYPIRRKEAVTEITKWRALQSRIVKSPSG